jgi:CBS-domain-containing membrane protein
MTADRFLPLPQSKLKAGAGYEVVGTQSFKKVNLHSPAIEVMTDLRRVEALTTTEVINIDAAEKMMIDYGVRSLIVVDSEHKITGIITSTDILSDKPMQIIADRGLLHSDLLVRDVMTPAHKIKVIDLQDVMKAKVGDVIETLKQSGRQHALVADVLDNGHQRLCGIFSATQIARQMQAEKATEAATQFA